MKRRAKPEQATRVRIAGSLSSASLATTLAPLDYADDKGESTSTTSSPTYVLPLMGFSPTGKRYHPSHPARRELEWLVYGETGQLTLPFGDESNEAFWNAFTLATFYFSTETSSWIRKEGWMTKTSACEWHGARCNDSLLSPTISPTSAANQSTSMRRSWN